MSPSAPPLDDDNLLSEILLRLPPQPSSLPRASAVCKRWHGLASDPGFSRRFRIHHRRNPPLLGCFMKDVNEFRFESAMEPPNRVPRARFPFPIDAGNRRFLFLGCRHGLILMLHTSQVPQELLVWDPVSGHEHYLAIPPGFGEKARFNAAVLRAVLPDTHHFQVVLADGDGLGLLFVSTSDCSVQLWKRTTDCDSIASWVLARIIELDKLLPLNSQNRDGLLLRAFAEENKVVFLWTFVGVFMVQLDSLQFEKLPEINLAYFHPFEAVYAAGI